MKKASKPVPKTPAKRARATKPSAKPKAKPSVKPKPREAPDQLELFPILQRLAQSIERLAQAAERLAEAIVPPPTISQQQHNRPGQPAEFLADLTAPALDMPVDDATEEE
jgi:hypothetical protein